MKRQVTTIAIVFSVVLNIAFVTGYAFRRFSQQPEPAYGDLDLTRQQRVRLEAAQQQLFERIQDTGRNMLELHSQLIDVVAREDRNSDALQAKLAEIREGQRTMLLTLVNHLLTEKEILTPHQRARYFASLREQIRGREHVGPRWFPRSDNHGGKQ